ncbi:hypothetical protein PO124_31485 [Bacillus licheniformis]|nr:hypothetical protein [Bacillus licheniformis]
MNGRNGATNVNNRAGNGNPVPTGDGTYSRGDMNYHNHLVNTADTGYDRPETVNLKEYHWARQQIELC